MRTQMTRILGSIVIFSILPNLAMGYPWPVHPFNTQHSVRSVLDECRGYRDHFHDGIDIDDATTGTPVFAVASGVAQVWPDYHTVRVGNYAYVHINPTVSEDSFITALQDTIGIVNGENANHLHFAEGPDKAELNPLRSGGIDPFYDIKKNSTGGVLCLIEF